MDENIAGARVLVMEDEYFLAEDITKALSRLGLTVIGPFASSDQALNSVDLDRVDTAILDLDLAGAIDFAVADALLAKRLPFVFATGYDATAIPPRFAEIRSYEKPCYATELTRYLLTWHASRCRSLAVDNWFGPELDSRQIEAYGVAMPDGRSRDHVAQLRSVDRAVRHHCQDCSGRRGHRHRRSLRGTRFHIMVDEFVEPHRMVFDHAATSLSRAFVGFVADNCALARGHALTYEKRWKFFMRFGAVRTRVGRMGPPRLGKLGGPSGSLWLPCKPGPKFNESL